MLFLFFYRLSERDLWSSHEARAAQNAQSILDSGDWVLPRLYDQRPELQKPPLYYWLVAGCALLRGVPVDACAVRLPAAFAALGCVVVLYFLAGTGGRRWAGLIAAAVLATAVHFTWLARVGRIDMPLTLAITAALGAYYQGQRRRKAQRFRHGWCWFLLAYLAVAAAVLLKGPIGAVLPGVVVLVHLVVEGEFGRRRRAGCSFRSYGVRLSHELGLWWGVPLLLGLALPWFWWVNARTDGEFVRVFFWYHNMERGFGGSGKLAVHPWWFYGPRFAVDFLPWTPAWILAVWAFWKRQPYRFDPKARFGLVWLITMTLLLSWMRFKRADYLLPAYPGAALFLGALAEHWFKERQEKKACPTVGMTALAVGGLMVTCVIGWAIYVAWYLPRQEELHDYKQLAAEIRRRVPPPQPVILFRTKVHALTFHLGRPVDTLLEWENLDWWAGRPGTYYVLMPPALARECPRRLKSGRLVEVLRTTNGSDPRPERDLLLMRTQPNLCPGAP